MLPVSNQRSSVVALSPAKDALVVLSVAEGTDEPVVALRLDGDHADAGVPFLEEATDASEGAARAVAGDEDAGDEARRAQFQQAVCAQAQH